MELTLKHKGSLMGSGCGNHLRSFICRNKHESEREFRPRAETVGSSAIISSLTSHISCLHLLLIISEMCLKTYYRNNWDGMISFLYMMRMIVSSTLVCVFNYSDTEWKWTPLAEKNRRRLTGKPLGTHSFGVWLNWRICLRCEFPTEPKTFINSSNSVMKTRR